MSALDMAQLVVCLSNMRSRRRVVLSDLPGPLLSHILSYCDLNSRQAAGRTCATLARAVRDLEVEQMTFNQSDCNDNMMTLDCLPADVLLTILKCLNRQDLGVMAQVCSRFRDLSYSDCIWLNSAKSALGSNQVDRLSLSRSMSSLSARTKVKIGEGWRTGNSLETIITVQGNKFMPRLQLESKRLWVSWGNKIWCHPRLPDGRIAKTTTRMLRGHSDDVSKFVVSQGMVVSGGRDRSLCAWSANSGNFLFARRYCHGGEITAVDIAGRGEVLVTGSKDKTALVWNVREDPRKDALLPVPVHQLSVEDRVWSMSVGDGRTLAVGTAATHGVAPIRLYDLPTGLHCVDLGRGLKNGAGMLDLSWLSPTTLLGCGYDTYTRLWDTRCGEVVRIWGEPFDESVYCLATDKVNLLVTGTSRHGRVRVWDMRNTSGKWLYMKYASPARRGQSSPVYSLAVDASNMYVAMDQSLNHFGFSGDDPKTGHVRRNYRY